MNALFSHSRTRRPVYRSSLSAGMSIFHLMSLMAAVLAAFVLVNTARAGVIPDPDQVMGETIGHAIEFDVLGIAFDNPDLLSQGLTGTYDSDAQAGAFSYSFPTQLINGVQLGFSGSGSGDPAAGNFAWTRNMQIGDVVYSGDASFTDFYGDPDRDFEGSLEWVETIKGTTTKYRYHIKGTIRDLGNGNDSSTEHIQKEQWHPESVYWDNLQGWDYTDTSKYNNKTTTIDSQNVNIYGNYFRTVIDNNTVTVTVLPEPGLITSIASGTFLLLAYALRRRYRP